MMIADERQHLIERYLSGAMTASESESFHTQLESDAELRRLLDAEHVMAGAFARDRSSIAAGSIVPSEGLMSALAASTVALAPATTAWYRGARGYIAAAVGITGVALGVFLIAPNGEDDVVRAPRAVSPSPVSAPATIARPSDAQTAERPAPDADASSDAAEASHRNAAVARDAIRERFVQQPKATPATGTEPARATDNTADASSTEQSVDTRSVESLPEIIDKDVPVNVHVRKKP